MKILFVLIWMWITAAFCVSQNLPPKQAYPTTIKQIHSGHSLTDPLFYPHWPGQFVNLIAHINGLQGWQLFDQMVGKSTVPGSSMNHRWNTPVGHGAPDARVNISNWQLLCITERVPLLVEGASTQQWYLDGIREQKEYLSRFVNNAWNLGNNGLGAPTLLWTTWTNLDNSNGPWRQMLDIQGAEFERMQDYANANRPSGAPPVYLIPGHKMMARLYDDILLNRVPGITNINQFFGDNIHTNELGAYAMSMIHYACIFNQSPVGLPNDLLPGAPTGTPIPTPALAQYLQHMIWDVVTSYPRTGIVKTPSDLIYHERREGMLSVYPNPVSDHLIIQSDQANTILPIRIYDATGNLVYSGTENQVDTRKLPVGPYFIKYGSIFIKIIKD